MDMRTLKAFLTKKIARSAPAISAVSIAAACSVGGETVLMYDVTR